MSEETERLGRYELLRRIAVGGMGEIYLARAHGAGGFEKTLIIKKILPHLASDPQFVDKFLDEGRIIVNLSHGNIVPVFDMDEDEGEYYIAMEYIPGRDVRTVMKKLEEVGEAVPPALACFVISEVCEGLAYAHRQTDSEGEPLNIVHRDVSPSNILLSTDGEVKLIDFGIARAAGRRSETVSGRVQGKVCYMSPEQATGGDVDPRSDIFSAGTVLYEMVTGIRPFQGDTDLESLDLVRQCDYPPPSDLAEGVPTEIDAVIGRAMARDPDERYDSADQMQSDLVQVLYTGGDAVTSRDLAEFLDDLFPEGVERQAFRDELSSDVTEVPEESGDSEPMGMDAALEEQLRRREQSGPDPRGRTATLQSDSQPESNSDGETTDSEGTASAPSSPSEPDPTAETPSEGWFRPWMIVATLLFVAVGGMATAFFVGNSEAARVTVGSEPAGARILVDGTELQGVRTPHTLRLSAGQHTVSVQKEGFENRTFTLELMPSAEESLSPDLSRSQPPDASNDASTGSRDPDAGDSDAADASPAVQTVVIETRPSPGSIWQDDERLGQSPLDVRIPRGKSRRIEVRRSSCQTETREVTFEPGRDRMVVELTCQPADQNQATTPSGGSKAVDRSVKIESEPSGADVFVDGKKVGSTPYSLTFGSKDPIPIKLSKKGYQSIQRTVAPGEVDDVWRATLQKKKMGCLNFFAIRPQYNSLAIDGEWLEGKRQSLKDYELPAGRHSIRVRNRAAEKDETFEFTVEPGDECTSLTVWDPDNGR